MRSGGAADRSALLVTTCGEALEGSFDEPGTGVGAFIGEDLGVGEAAVVVDGGVDVVVAGTVLVIAVSVRSIVGASAFAVGDVSDLLGVHVGEFAWPFAFVASGGLLR